MIAALKLLRSAPFSARLGLGMVLVTLLAAILAPVIAPYGETEVSGDVWLQASKDHFIGTDNLGRDLFSRLLFGARNTIAIAFVITALSFVSGVIWGFLAATVGGWMDQLLSRCVDIMMAFPSLMLAIIIIAIASAMITPTVDPFNMALVMLPLIVLYGLSILLSYLA